MSEFQLIEWLRSQQGLHRDDVGLGIGDDAAVLKLPAGAELVVSTDTLNEDIHFDSAIPPEALGYKALAVSLSDLAAMGALPRWALLSLSMPSLDQGWFESFSSGFLKLAKSSGVSLVGGDTCSGKLSISVTVMGTVAAGKAIMRSGARPGDLVVVSGTLGDAALALFRLQAEEASMPSFTESLYRPVPRVALGQSLVGNARACIDISDGLLADLGHVCRASSCGARIELKRLPASEDVMDLDASSRQTFQLGGGEDYELCFSLPPGKRSVLSALERELAVPLTVIGEITSGSEIHCVKPDGTLLGDMPRGYEHFK